MVNFFKRSDPGPCVSVVARTLKEPASDTGERRRSPRPLPNPEVVEGNDSSDWALWEESVSLQDSQMPIASPPPTQNQKQRGTPDKNADLTDAFASVHKHSG